jgi:competence protein ComEA
MVRNALVLTALLVLTTSAASIAAPAQQTAAQKPASPTTTLVAAPINVNTATSAELEKLPGVGPAMALRIVEYRQKNNGFKKLEDLMQVKGIGEKTFLKLKPLVTITPARTSER